MRDKAKKALAFPVLWVLYCVAIAVMQADKRTFATLAGLALGGVFLYATGLLLLMASTGKTLRTWVLPVLFAVLVALDQGAKLLVLRHVPPGAGVPVFGAFLSIRFLPNYHNNVLLNMLDIMLPPVLVKGVGAVLVAAVAVVFAVYCTRRGYDMRDARFRLMAVLFCAGAVCSVAESFYRGYILDFISFAGLVGFDFKDLYIMYGAGLLITVFAEWENEHEAKQKAAGGGK